MTAAIPARNISGCRRQLGDALAFAPILLAAIAVGLALLIANFWLANWTLTCITGGLYILSFVSTPMLALALWQKWVQRPTRADVLLAVHDEGLVFRRIAESAETHMVRWQDIIHVKSRSVMKAMTVKLSMSPAAAAPAWVNDEYMICADREVAQDLIRQLHAHEQQLG